MADRGARVGRCFASTPVDLAERIAGRILGTTIGMIVQRHTTACASGLRGGIPPAARDQRGPVAHRNVGVDAPAVRRGRERAEGLGLPCHAVRDNAESPGAVRDVEPMPDEGAIAVLFGLAGLRHATFTASLPRRAFACATPAHPRDRQRGQRHRQQPSCVSDGACPTAHGQLGVGPLDGRNTHWG